MKSRMRACLSLSSSSLGFTPCRAYGGVVSTVARTFVSRSRDFVHFVDDALEALDVLLILPLQIAQALLELALLPLHALSHVHDDFDARQIDAQLIDEPLHLAQMLDVLVRIQPDVAAGPGGIHQADALVMAQRLRMDATHARSHADDVVVEVAGLSGRTVSRRCDSSLRISCDWPVHHPSRCLLSSWKSSRSRAERLVGRMTRSLA